MWNKKAPETISERPDEEEDQESNRELDNLGNNLKENKTNIDRILDFHKEQQAGYNFLIDNTKINVKKKLLEQSYKEKQNSNRNFTGRNFTSQVIIPSVDRSSLFNEKDKVKKSQSNSYRFVKIEDNNIFNNEDFPIVIKLEETKETNKGSRRVQENLTGRNYNIVQQPFEIKQEELEKFSSIKSVTNSEKMRQYIRFKEAWNYFSSSDLSNEKKLIKTEDFSQYNCLYRMYLNCSKKLLLHYELLDERDLVFAIAKVPLNYNDEFHLRMLTTLYKTLTQDVECPIKGDHWTKIGFQGADPSTDLRGNGMLSILQSLAFMDILLTYVKEIYSYSLDETFNFPFMCVLINLSSYSLEALKEGYLITFCNEKNSIINSLNKYFFGMVDHFFTIYKNMNLTLESVHSVMEEVSKYAKKNSEKIFLLGRNLMIKYPPTIKDSMSLGEDNNIE